MIDRQLDDFDDFDDFDDEVEPAPAAQAPAFNWSDEQRSTLDKVERWRRNRDKQLFRLFGFAGTGKTTVTREIARRAGGNVLYCAYTGKAALVMRSMGCTDASTIHSLIYRPVGELVEEAKAIKAWLENIRQLDLGGHERDGGLINAEREAMQRWGTTDRRELERRLYQIRARLDAGPSWVLREKLDPRPDVIIVDECSMVAEPLARDLMAFDIPIIVIGDPFQLPPVGGTGYFTEAQPDAMLKEVHRQALGSPVTRMATMVRTDGAYALKPGTYDGDSRYVSAGGDETTEMLLDANQVLCGTNRNRRIFNAAMREALGYAGTMPMPGERIICRHNNRPLGLLNGGMWIVKSCDKAGDCFKAEITSVDDGTDREGIVMHAGPFAGREVLPEDKRDADEFDWGYAITVHSAQGSQWRKVALINDGWHDGRVDRFGTAGSTPRSPGRRIA